MVRVGENEALKASVHGAVGLLAAVCTVYNAAAFVTRRQVHLGFNVLLYGGLTYWEYRRLREHLAQRSPAA